MGRRVGVLGGSFDPPHVGHLILAQEAWWQLGLDEVRLVPAARPPHKPAGPTLPAELRARLVERAVAGHPALRLARLEIARPGPSYTADTLDEIAAAEPTADLWFVLGADQLVGFPGWHDPGRILARARLAVALRPGHDREAVAETAEAVAPGRVDTLRMPEIGVSSTMVRRRMAEGWPIRFLVPPGVEEELAACGLLKDALTHRPPRARSG